jgi:hypothetical protein
MLQLQQSSEYEQIIITAEKGGPVRLNSLPFRQTSLSTGYWKK